MSCVSAVRSAVKGLPGVESVEGEILDAKAKKGRATVRVDTGKTDAASVANAIDGVDGGGRFRATLRP